MAAVGFPSVPPQTQTHTHELQCFQGATATYELCIDTYKSQLHVNLLELFAGEILIFVLTMLLSGSLSVLNQ